MKMALLTAVALVATPAFAQMTPTPAGGMPADQSQSMTPPAQTTAPSSMPMNNGSMPAAMPTDGTAPMPMAGGKLPWCRKGQYTACREHENAKGEGVSKM